MKLLKKYLLIFAFVVPMVLYSHEHEMELNVDVNSSKIVWTGKKITGSSHTGEIKLQSGKIHIRNGNLHGGTFTIDMNSIVNIDLDDKQKNARLVGHLKSDDFFSVDTYPTASLNVTKVLKNFFAGENQPTHTISGDLTIKGKTHPITFPATIHLTGNNLHAKASFEFDRSKYDVRYGSGSFFDNLGDNLILDNIQLDIELVSKNNEM